MLPLGSCVCSVQLCGPSTCPGCCDADEICQTGNQDAVCGELGALCVDCTATGRVCGGSACRPRGGGDAGTSASDAGACTGACSSPGIVCDADGGYATCIQYSATCWDWIHQDCPAGSVCSGQSCRFPDGGCANECSGSSAIQCITFSSYETCVADLSGCYVWGTPVLCIAGLQCAEDAGCVSASPDAGAAPDGSAMGSDAGPCASTCSPGQTECVGSQVSVCQPHGDCWTWGSAGPCPIGMACAGGSCQCANDCTVPGASQCNGTDIQVCIATTAGCQTWQTVACGSPYACSVGRCVTSPPVNVGGACATDADCGGPAGYALCEVAFPQGYCISACAGTASLAGIYYCPGDAFCFTATADGGSAEVCLSSCPQPGGGQSTCRTDYVCESYGAYDPNAPTVPLGTCVPNCNWFDANAADAGGSAAFCGTGSGPDGGPYCQPSGYCR